MSKLLAKRTSKFFWLVVEPTHLKNMLVKMGIFWDSSRRSHPKFQMFNASGQIIIFHQPRFVSLPQLHFAGPGRVRSLESDQKYAYPGFSFWRNAFFEHFSQSCIHQYDLTNCNFAPRKTRQNLGKISRVFRPNRSVAAIAVRSVRVGYTQKKLTGRYPKMAIHAIV